MKHDNPREMRSIYRRGADNGLWLGAYMSVVMLLLLFTVRAPLACALPAAALMLAMPALVWWQLRRSYRLTPSTMAFLWAEGVVAFVCGALITGVVTWVTLKWILPDFISEEMYRAARLLNASTGESAHRMGNLLVRAIENHMIPTAGKFAANVVLLAVFSGSMLSMIIAAAITRIKRK